MHKAVRVVFLRSGKGTRWDLLKALIFPQFLIMPAAIALYGFPDWKVLALVLMTMALTIVGFMLAYDRVFG